MPLTNIQRYQARYLANRLARRIWLYSSTVLILCLGFAATAGAQSGSVTISDFPRHQTTLPPGQEAQLQLFATAVAGALIAGSSVDVSVYGHADFDANGRDFEIEVSQQRAKSARQSFETSLQQQAQLGVLRADQLANLKIKETLGLGTYRPVFRAPANEEERQANRRVEFAWTVRGPASPQPASAFPRCQTVLQSAVATGPGRRMTCACGRLAAGAADTHYDFSARRDIPGSAGMPNLSPQQWQAAMSQLIRHMRQDVAERSNNTPADGDFAASLIALDDRIGLNINNFHTAAAGDLVPGLFDRVIDADIRQRMSDANHIYSCYAGYSRSNHDQ